jgi:hypothetical protein
MNVSAGAIVIVVLLRVLLLLKLLEALFALHVVHFPLPAVGEHLVRALDLLVLVAVGLPFEIGVVLPRQLPEVGLDLLLRRVLLSFSSRMS